MVLDLKVFTERLSDLIFDGKNSVSKTASQIGVSKSTLYEYLSGSKMPTMENFVKIADFFEVTTDYLLGRERENYTKTFAPAKKFYQRLPLLLSHFKISRYRLKQMTGLSESTLYYWAQGQTTPSVEKLILLADVLDCTVDFVLGRTL